MRQSWEEVLKAISGPVTGLDGKRYPGNWADAERRAEIVGEAHRLHHEEHLSVRKIKSALSDRYGIQRSVGWVSTVINTWTCQECSGVPNGSPEHQ